MQKTLVVQHYPGIGDLVWHIPYIRAIASSSKAGKVTILTRPSCRAFDVLSGESCIEDVIEFDYKPRNKATGRHDGLIGKLLLAADLRRRKFDRIVIFSDRACYAAMALFAGIPLRIGFGFRPLQRLYLNSRPFIRPHTGSGSAVYPEATSLAIAHGFVDRPIVPKMQVPTSLIDKASEHMAQLPRPRYAFAIGASDPKKNWGGQRFLELAKILINAGCGVVFLGGPAEREDAERQFSTANGLKNEAFQIVCQASVLYAAAILKSCDFCLGNDTGVLNVAAACDVPALGLFGSTPPLTHDPLLHALPGRNMDEISVESVINHLPTSHFQHRKVILSY
ncbi:MAG: glycosyl transferase family 9 [Firmicutes bacterium]|nr:glycosyl transferase family 9 [Bacillota bacterium]